MASPLLGSVQYRIDSSDRLVWTNAGWDAFATENGYGRAVLHTVLWDHITDRSTVHLYRAMIQQVRKTRKPMNVPFRCDSPTKIRQMRLKMESLEHGVVQFSAHTEAVRDRRPVRLIDVSAPRAAQVLFMCSWCKRVLIDEWMELERAAEYSRMFDAPALPTISHGICDTCSNDLQQTFPG